jgi:hypothetical protein
MRMTVPGKDVIRIDEKNLDMYKKEVKSNSKKFHVIKLDFKEPTEEKVDEVVDNFANTNRFVISNNIKFYNGLLKNVGKKYYIQNTSGENFVSFVRKNNKIMVDFTRMTQAEKTFLMENYFEDILRNTEIIIIDECDLSTGNYADILKSWQGNVIVRDAAYSI